MRRSPRCKPPGSRGGLPHGIDPDSIEHGAAFLAAAFAAAAG
jgi:hypothetical protein